MSFSVHFVPWVFILEQNTPSIPRSICCTKIQIEIWNEAQNGLLIMKCDSTNSIDIESCDDPDPVLVTTAVLK